MLYLLYSTLGYTLYAFLVLLLPLARLFGGRYGYGLEQRLGRYQPGMRLDGSPAPLLWIHASSVGEVQAALILIKTLLGTGKSVQIIVSSTTEQGQKMAAARLGTTIPCVLAPLDFPPAVQRAIHFFRPTLYIGLETELWPVMLTALGQTSVPKLLLNGRLSERSLKRYLHVPGFIRPLVAGFQALSVISADDGVRFVALGAPKSKVRVSGNLKYDMPAENNEEKRQQLRLRLGASRGAVFLCGSTHDGEEELLWPAVQPLLREWPLIWVVAPRHLERLPAVISFFRRVGIDYHLYSELTHTTPTHRAVLVDTMGDLADLYCAGDYIFCGGSLVDRGGHNIIEAARWGRPVYYGPYMKDFKDAAELLRDNGGGFQVKDSQALLALLRLHHSHPEAYNQACQRALATAASQHGSVDRQVALVLQCLESGTPDHAEGVFLA
ncbi:MAG: glycosyltransferase N-terminal domain-containing protein [Desulfobulbus sp.]|nr:glycosyltransferase N-terminal domain-containing protein [Desulfobulbus sp.]